MNRFLKTIFIFTLPYLIVTLFFLFVYFSSRESYFSFDTKTEKQIGYIGSEKLSTYKINAILQRPKYSIWVLGTSRVLQFRKEMFTKQFYNLGLSVTAVRSYIDFLKKIPANKLPDYLLVSLDQRNFNNKYETYESSLVPPYSFEKLSLYEDFKSFIKNLILNPNLIWEYLKNIGQIGSDDIGLYAKVYMNGFRNDGSHLNGYGLYKTIKTNNNQNFTGWFVENLKTQSTHGFEEGEFVDPRFINEVENLIKFCATRHIKPIIFLPPFPPSVFDKLNNNKYSYIKKASKQLSALCINKGVPFFDFTHIDSVYDHNFLDGTHGSEIVNLKLLTLMDQSSEVHRMGIISGINPDTNSNLFLFKSDSLKIFKRFEGTRIKN